MKLTFFAHHTFGPITLNRAAITGMIRGCVLWVGPYRVASVNNIRGSWFVTLFGKEVTR